MNSATPSRSLLLAAVFLAGPILAHAAGASTPVDTVPKDFVAFVGLDILVTEQGKDCPVVSYQEPQLSILHGNQQVRVPASDARYKLSTEPKLGRRAVTVAELRAEAVFDPRTDPIRAGMEQQLVMDHVQSHQQDIAAVNASAASANASSMLQQSMNPYSGITASDVAAANAQAAKAINQLGESYSMPMFRANTPGQYTAEGDAAADAFQVTFRLSADEEVRNAFGLLRMQVRDPANSRQPVAVLKFFALRNLGPAGRKVTVLQTGLPLGFTVDSFNVHIYSEGTELPTNLSPNRIELSINEAHQFLILRHSQVYRTETVPAQIIPELVPADVQAWLAKIASDATVDIGIGRDGRVTKVTAVRANADLSVADVENRLREVRFLPALVKGSPVDSEGTFGLSEFSH